jgi:hypothetical protein
VEGGREGFLLAKYHAELMLIGCMVRFDNKRRHLPICVVNAKIMVLQTHKNIKRRSAANSLQHIAFSAGHSQFNQL